MHVVGHCNLSACVILQPKVSKTYNRGRAKRRMWYCGNIQNLQHWPDYILIHVNTSLICEVVRVAASPHLSVISRLHFRRTHPAPGDRTNDHGAPPLSLIYYLLFHHTHDLSGMQTQTQR
jgi:hypothetical protein